MRVHRLLTLSTVALLGSALAWAAVELPLSRRMLEPLELTTLDWRVRSAARGTQSAEIALVLFDDSSVARWPYLMPFPRTVLADLIDAVAQSGASVIALDVYLDRLYPDLAALGGSDAALRAAIAKAGNVVLVADVDLADGEYELRPPHAYFAGAASAIAASDLPTPYETVRDAVLAVRTRSGMRPGIALALYAAHRGRDVDSLLDAASRTGTLPLPGLRGSLSRPHPGVVTMPLPFRGPPSHAGSEGAAFRAFAASQVLDGIPAEWLAGRIVLIGSGFHAEDRFRTPFHEHVRADGTTAGWTYGTEIHATAVDGLLAGGVPAPLSDTGLLALLLMLSLAIAGATFLRGVAAGALVAALLSVVLAVAAWYVFAERAIHIPLVAPGIAAGMTLMLSSGWVSIIEGREKRRIRSAFGRYVAPEIVAELSADPRRLRLSGEKREITIVFTDLVGFTPLSESAPPERIVALLNEYLDEMAGIVLAGGGMLDKYIGDAVMALFGAPRPQPDHAVRACRAALRMQERLAALNTLWREAGWPALKMRVGINSGEPIVGNIGGRDRFDYTALGDAVNLAARLEPACRTYGVGILISESTRSALGNAFIARELDVITVVGRSETVRVFELVAEAANTDPEREHAHEQFAAGLDAYRRRDFTLAEQYFAATAASLPQDAAAQLYLERCRSLRGSPPPADWDHVTRRSVK